MYDYKKHAFIALFSCANLVAARAEYTIKIIYPLGIHKQNVRLQICDDNKSQSLSDLGAINEPLHKSILSKIKSHLETNNSNFKKYQLTILTEKAHPTFKFTCDTISSDNIKLINNAEYTIIEQDLLKYDDDAPEDYYPTSSIARYLENTPCPAGYIESGTICYKVKITK